MEAKLQREQEAHQATLGDLQDLRTAYDQEAATRRQLEQEIGNIAASRDRRMRELTALQGALRARGGVKARRGAEGRAWASQSRHADTLIFCRAAYTQRAPPPLPLFPVTPLAPPPLATDATLSSLPLPPPVTPCFLTPHPLRESP